MHNSVLYVEETPVIIINVKNNAEGFLQVWNFSQEWELLYFPSMFLELCIITYTQFPF